MKTFAWIVCMWSLKMTMGQTERYDLVINEIMADPSPIVGLPNAEYIELKNVSGRTIDLQRFRIDNGTTAATITSTYLLPADSMVVLCSRTQSFFFNGIKTIGLSSFPALGNEGGLITLKSPEGKTIHAVEYRSSWYGNPVKSGGGWSLEMIDPLQPCVSGNWTASRDIRGGTPGSMNSVAALPISKQQPEPLQCMAVGADKLLLMLDQGADSLSGQTPSLYRLDDPDIMVMQARSIPPLFSNIELTLGKKLGQEKVYTLFMRGLKRCRSDQRDSLSIRTGLLKEPQQGDLVINEILFNPPPDGADYLEIRNNSSAVINAKGLFLATKNELGVMGAGFTVSPGPFNIFPGEAVAITTDTGFIRRRWKSSPPQRLIQTGSMPSMADDKGHVLLLNAQGGILDALNYTDDMHFPLIKERSAVALERINPFVPAAAKNNWQSAAASAGYGTPGFVNSQFMQTDSAKTMVSITPQVLTPDNDGREDMLQISYQFEQDGYMMNAYLFSENGQLLCKVVDNQLCGTTGSFYWNGLRNNQRLPDGLYIIMTDLMRPNGKRLRYKKLIGIRSG